MQRMLIAIHMPINMATLEHGEVETPPLVQAVHDVVVVEGVEVVVAGGYGLP